MLSDLTKKSRYDRGEDPNQRTCKGESSWGKAMHRFREERRKYEEEMYEQAKESHSRSREFHKCIMSFYFLRSSIRGPQVQYYNLFENIKLGNLKECYSLIDKVEVIHGDFKRLVIATILYERKEIFNLLKERVEISPNDILSYVSKYKSEEFFDYFLSEYLDTLDINHKDKKGNTALHHALEWFAWNESKYQDFAKSLLSKGARLGVKNNKGETPFDLLVNYVDRYFEWYDVCGPFNRKTMQSLDLVVRLLSNCTDKGILKGLNGTPALNKLVKIVVDCDHKEALDLLVENNIRISSTTLEKIVTCDFNEKIFGCFLHKNKIDYQDEREGIHFYIML